MMYATCHAMCMCMCMYVYVYKDILSKDNICMGCDRMCVHVRNANVRMHTCMHACKYATQRNWNVTWERGTQRQKETKNSWRSNTTQHFCITGTRTVSEIPQWQWTAQIIQKRSRSIQSGHAVTYANKAYSFRLTEKLAACKAHVQTIWKDEILHRPADCNLTSTFSKGEQEFNQLFLRKAVCSRSGISSNKKNSVAVAELPVERWSLVL